MSGVEIKVRERFIQRDVYTQRCGYTDLGGNA